MDWDSSDNTYLNNSHWIALVAVKCIITTLAYNLRSTHLQIKFLEILVRCNFHTDLPGTLVFLCYLFTAEKVYIF